MYRDYPHYIDFRYYMYIIFYILFCPGADLDALDDQGNTALLHAASHGHYSIVIFLGKCGGDFSHRNDVGKSVWDFALEQLNSDLLKVFSLSAMPSQTPRILQ